MAGKEDTKNNRDGRVENPRDDPQSSSTKPAASSPHNSPENDGSAIGQRQSNTPHETSTPGIYGSSAPPHGSPENGDRSAVIAPPATRTENVVASITIIWGFLCLWWNKRLVRLILTAAYSYLFYKIFPLKLDLLSTMTLFLLIHWIIQSFYKNTGSIFLLTIAVLGLIWLVYTILVDIIIVQAVRSIYLTPNKASQWILVLQTLKVMFFDFEIFIGDIPRAIFGYMRYWLSRSGQGPAQFQLLPEDMLVPT